MRGAEEVGLVAELLSQAFGFLVDFSLSPPALLLFPFLLLLLILKELQRLSLFLLLASPAGLLGGFGLAFLLALLGLDLCLQACGLGVNLPLRARIEARALLRPWWL